MRQLYTGSESGEAQKRHSEARLHGEMVSEHLPHVKNLSSIFFLNTLKGLDRKQAETGATCAII